MSHAIHEDKPNGKSNDAKPAPKRKGRKPVPAHWAVHTTPHTSMLSSEYREIVNFRGLVNCMALFLIISNLPRMFRNFQDYGAVVLRFTLTVLSFQESSADLFIGTWFVLVGFVCAGFLIGRLEVSFPKLNLVVWDFLHTMNTIGALVLPTWLLFKSSGLYILSMGTALAIIVVHMKLWSFGHFCSSIRAAPTDGDGNDKAVRHHLTLSHYAYFFAAPTMCYQAKYPREPGPIRISFVLRRSIEVIFCSLLILFIFGQIIPEIPALRRRNKVWYVVPFLPTSKSGGLFESSDPIRMVITILRVSVPSTCVWLLMFYGFFHSFLNLSSELLRFSDRQFYKDWWNSTDIAEYWRKWNMPVHHWAFRHIYQPLRRMGVPALGAMFAVFFYSSVMHEVVVDAALHFIPSFPHGFVGMIGQIPLIFVTKTITQSKFIKTEWNNLVFWIAFCVCGQPLAILLYAQDFARVQAA